MSRLKKDLCRYSHPYLMKYLAMICRGHVPVYKGRINRDARQFIRYFMSGASSNRSSIGKAIRHLHLAFKGMQTEEIYDVLMEQFLRAAAKYDPNYTEKVKQVVEVIENALSGTREFRAADVDRHLEFNCHRFLRMLFRRGLLTSEKREGQKYAIYRRTQKWPLAKESFGGRAIACQLQKGRATRPMGRSRD
jgi:hypothetical protein